MGRLIKKILFLFFSFIIISCEQAVYTGSPDEPTVQNRKLFVQSKPSHATIYLNGKNLGIATPDTIRWIQSESVTISLKLPLYSDTSIHVYVPSGNKNSVFVDFTKNSKNYGKIFCESDPGGADVLLNDSLINLITPVTLNTLKPGSYKVKIRKKEHRADSTTVVVESNATAKVFLSLEDTSKWVSYNKKNSGILSNFISTLSFDKSSNIWFGTDIGLVSFNGKKFKYYTKANSPFRSDYITSVVVDSQNRKWVGTANGLMVLDNNVWTDLSSGLPDSHVTAILFDHSGSVWIGTYNGIAKYSNGTWQQFNSTNSGLKENFVTCLTVDSHDRIWIGYKSQGVSVYDGNSWTNYNTSNLQSKFLTLEFVTAIACDNKDNIWVSAMNPTSDYASALFFDGTKWSQSLYMDTPYSIYTNGSYVLFGCKVELVILDNNTGKYARYYGTANKALPLFRLQTVTMDNANNIWIGTFMYGVGKLKKGNF